MSSAARRGWGRWQVAFCLAVGAAWLSAGARPFANSGALSPTDFTRDFVAAKVLLRGDPVSELDAARGNAEAVRSGADPVLILNNGFFHHPPPAALPILPLVPLGYPLASLVWLGLSVALLWRLAHLLVLVIERSPIPVRAPVLFLLLLLWPPVLSNIQLGQWSIILAWLIAEGHRRWEHQRPLAGGLFWGAAATLKLTPLALLPFVALRDRRAGLIIVCVLAAGCALAFPFGRLDPWLGFLRDMGPNVTGWQTWWHNTLSINGFFARQFTGGPFARPLLHAPALTRALGVASAIVLVMTALVFGRAGGETRDRAREGCRFALWAILVVVLNPLGWHHYAILLLLPAALILRAADEGVLSEGDRRRLRGIVAAALVVLTIPKEALYLLVQPLPTSPARSLLLSLHAYAALAVFAAAARGAREPRHSVSCPAGPTRERLTAQSST
jgi:hypothetical protein